jgi:MerR HTH family regulatory protein
MNVRRTRTPQAHSPWADHVDERPVELVVVAREAGVRRSLVRRYVAFGLFEPSSGTSQTPLFAPSCAGRLAKAERLRRDLGLNYAGAVLACELLDRILELEDQARRGPQQPD